MIERTTRHHVEIALDDWQVPVPVRSPPHSSPDLRDEVRVAAPGGQFLRTPPKLHSLQLEDEQLQILDFSLIRSQLRLLRQNQGLQRFRTESVEFRQC